MSCHTCGFNPGFSDTMAGIQMGLAGLRGVVSTLEARNNGADIGTALAYGTHSTAMGFGTALMGRAIDYGTHSYVGTTTTNLMNTFAFNNPFATNMLGASMFATMPLYSMHGGFCSPWAHSPLMFGAGMPAFGGCCWHC